MRRWLAIAAVVSLSGSGAVAQTLPTGFAVTNLITSGLSSPTCFCIAPDGRVFIGQQGGAVRIWKPGTGLLSTPFHQFGVSFANERGLIGIALDPDFSSTPYVYVHFTRSSPTVGGSIARVRASVANADVSEAGSQVELFFIGASNSDAHVGGGMHFGPDGKLYLGVGDQTVSSNAQSLNNLHGKILRLNPDGSIPVDNPTAFGGVAGSPTGQNRAMWALGLRNPFTMAFHPVTGRLFINDVGNMTFEEVDEGTAGANFGWPATEGDFNQGSFPSFTRPRHAYGRSTGVAVVAGAFYAPPVSPYPPTYHGAYFFGDYGAAWLRRLDPNTGVANSFATNAGNVVDVRVDSTGRLTCLSRGTGRLWRVDYTQPLGPTIITPPQSRDVSAGATVTFDVIVSGAPTLTYEWRRNDAALVDGGAVSGATTRMLTLTNVQSANAGSYRCFVSNATGNALSGAAMLTVASLDQRGDTNCDGAVSFADIDPFLLALFDPAAYVGAFPECALSSADMNGDEHVDFFDIQLFVDCVVGIACP